MMIYAYTSMLRNTFAFTLCIWDKMQPRQMQLNEIVREIAVETSNFFHRSSEQMYIPAFWVKMFISLGI